MGINKKGFTLIEIMVVLTIMGVLMGLTMTGFVASRKTARDGKRKADLEQIRSALQMYHTDCGEYPASVSFGGSLPSCLGPSVTYMSQVPQDLLDPTYQYQYSRNAVNPHAYNLCAHLENGTGSFSDCGGNCGSTCNYKVTQP